MATVQILIIDFGSQYTLVIGRTLRELGYRSLILPPADAERWLADNRPKLIILSGGNASVEDDDCPHLSADIFSLKIPILGICLGMQWIAKTLGGTVTSAFMQHKEYGPVFIETTDTMLFNGVDNRTLVWASHGDCVQDLPSGFRVIARSEDYHTKNAIANKDNTIVGIQFHPEVEDTRDGKRILQNFLDHCDCLSDWKPQDVIAAIQDEVRTAVTVASPTDAVIANAILGISGGVDSSVVAALLQPVFGEHLRCVVIDSGFLRLNELEEIKHTAKDKLGVSYIVVDAAARFQSVLAACIEPEEKRKRFKRIYQQILEEEAKAFEAQFIIQGSLATDFIESGNAGASSLIKSHHNIGIEWNLKELHPLRTLFKYEVRSLGKALRLPDSITQRQPFPGPGLMVRIIGTPATIAMADILRSCDSIVREVLEDHGVYDDISQVVVALDGTKTVGVKGDARVYGYSIIVRPVITKDFMTCSIYDLPRKIIDEIVHKVTQHPEITRVFVDYTPKPPGTTELE